MAEVALFSLLSPHFFTPDNLLNVSLQISITSIIAVGMTFVILTSGIDLSVGSLVALVGVITTSVVRLETPLSMPLSIAAGLGVGLLSGAIAGMFVTRFRVTPFIVTLALMTVWRGAAFIYTDARPVWDLPPSFGVPGGGRVLGVPIPTIIMLVIFAAAHIALTKTRFGRHVYAVGGNAEAARLAGIRTDRVLMQVYVICGVLTAISGILLASRLNSGQPNAGQMYELDVIAAVVVGGASFLGGRGTIIGTFIGSMLIGVLRNGLNLMDVNSYVQQVIVGAVILLAVLMDQTRSK
jgi:ribose/xylose/arabinose/galactoside ABC-type transport system permease subunit